MAAGRPQNPTDGFVAHAPVRLVFFAWLTFFAETLRSTSHASLKSSSSVGRVWAAKVLISTSLPSFASWSTQSNASVRFVAGLSLIRAFEGKALWTSGRRSALSRWVRLVPYGGHWHASLRPLVD
jgi:hypothetical protein